MCGRIEAVQKQRFHVASAEVPRWKADRVNHEQLDKRSWRPLVLIRRFDEAHGRSVRAVTHCDQTIRRNLQRFSFLRQARL